MMKILGNIMNSNKNIDIDVDIDIETNQQDVLDPMSPLVYVIDENGERRLISKSSYLWMVTEPGVKLSNDRTRRFKSNVAKKRLACHWIVIDNRNSWSLRIHICWSVKQIMFKVFLANVNENSVLSLKRLCTQWAIRPVIMNEGKIIIF